MKDFRVLSTLVIGFLLSTLSLTAQTGKDCSNPEPITTLPFNKVNLTTDGKGDDYSTSPCNNDYMTGDDYVFAFTPAVDQYLTIRLENVSTWTGLHILDQCPDVATSCYASDIRSAAGQRLVKDLQVSANTTYFIIVSTFSQPQTTDFDIHVEAGTPPPPGWDCALPKNITALPFEDNGQSTADFGDNYSGTGPCSSNDYLNSNEIVYLYKPAYNESVNFEVTNIDGFFTGIQVMDNCPDASPSCVASAFNEVSKDDLIVENIYLEKDQEYYIIISTWQNPPVTDFDFAMTSNRFCQDPTDVVVVEKQPTAVNINWTGDATSWNIEVTPKNMAPTGNTTEIFTRPYTITGLAPNTAYDVYLESNCEASSLMITGVYDGPLSGGNPKGVELYVVTDIANLSDYGIGSANNGEGTDGKEFTFPPMAVQAGTFIYWTSDQPLFESFFGTPAQYSSTDALINGNDAVELFHFDEVVDQYGFIDIDGTGQSWEYKDGWAYRRAGQENNGGAFDPTKWEYSGVDNLEGDATNETCDVPFPIGSFIASPALQSDRIGPISINTSAGPAECDGLFYDNGGSVAAYDANSLDTVLICPDEPGFTVSVTFQSFDVEAEGSTCVDELFIYDGDSPDGALISAPGGDSWCWDSGASSPNGTGNLAGETIKSTGQTGCLTFVFLSDDNGDHAGWVANVTCTAESDCAGATNLSAVVNGQTEAQLSWTVNASRAVSVDISYGINGIAPDDGTMITNATAPYPIENLTPSTAYDFFVRTNCGAFGTSEWAGPHRFVTGCSSAVGDEMSSPILINSLPYSMVSSTESCYSNSLGHPSADAIFKIEIDRCVSSIKASTCSDISDFDTVIRLLDENGEEINYNDDAAVADCGLTVDLYNRLSILESSVSGGKTYYIVVEGFGPHEGAFELQVEEGSLEGFSVEEEVFGTSCAEVADGSIRVEVDGGTAPFVYNWSNGESEFEINELIGGVYELTLTDDCDNEQLFEYEVPSAEPIILSSEVIDATGVGRKNGGIRLNIQGGEMPMTYQWSNGAETKNLIDLPGGEYCVTVTDANACAKETCVMVNSGTTSIRDLDELTLIQLQPNPTDQFADLRIEFDQPTDIELSVVNAIGALIWDVRSEAVIKKTIQLDVRAFPPGVYFVQVNYLDRAVVQKLVVRR